MIPYGVGGACRPTKSDSGQIIIRQIPKEKCMLQCKIGYFQSEIPYQACNAVEDRTVPEGECIVDKKFCKGAASATITFDFRPT